jgi:hypothetical protein
VLTIAGGGGPPAANFVGRAGGGDGSEAVRLVRGEGGEGSAENWRRQGGAERLGGFERWPSARRGSRDAGHGAAMAYARSGCPCPRAGEGGRGADRRAVWAGPTL